LFVVIQTNASHKVITYSTLENFQYQTWKDFSGRRTPWEKGVKFPYYHGKLL
jgi:hypothetical protein